MKRLWFAFSTMLHGEQHCHQQAAARAVAAELKILAWEATRMRR